MNAMHGVFWLTKRVRLVRKAEVPKSRDGGYGDVSCLGNDCGDRAHGTCEGMLARSDADCEA